MCRRSLCVLALWCVGPRSAPNTATSCYSSENTRSHVHGTDRANIPVIRILLGPADCQTGKTTCLILQRNPALGAWPSPDEKIAETSLPFEFRSASETENLTSPPQSFGTLSYFFRKRSSRGITFLLCGARVWKAKSDDSSGGRTKDSSGLRRSRWAAAQWSPSCAHPALVTESHVHGAYPSLCGQDKCRIPVSVDRSP